MLWGIAIVAVALLLGTWYLAKRRTAKMNRAAIACAIISILLHVALIVLLPYTRRSGGGPVSSQANEAGTVAVVSVATFSDAELVDQAADSQQDGDAGPAGMAPLPIQTVVPDRVPAKDPPVEASSIELAELDLELPESLEKATRSTAPNIENPLDSMLADMLLPSANPAELAEQVAEQTESSQIEAIPASAVTRTITDSSPQPTGGFDGGRQGRVLGDELDDFANRRGAARQQALIANGGDPQTEVAVEAGLAWLSRFQKPDGSWDPVASGAGIERSVLGQHRNGAGGRAATGISGLALLSMLGAGNTHQEGQHQQAVRNGLQYLLGIQAPDGSMSGQADPYARTYCHGMASLAMAETAAMSGDLVALESARASAGYTIRMQHPTTGGWRYVAGDPGDMSQAGWQAMMLISARRAGVEIPDVVLQRTRTFLQSVRAGRTGGLASYKPGEGPSRTMTAEALATRLLLGENVPAAEIAEAEQYILAEMPGTGPDNYYYWYYASLALHQLQDDAWKQWNQRMKKRLLETQLPDGSWSTATVWGGNGGKVYTTAMACLCLEVYYRHAVGVNPERSKSR